MVLPVAVGSCCICIPDDLVSDNGFDPWRVVDSCEECFLACCPPILVVDIAVWGSGGTFGDKSGCTSVECGYIVPLDSCCTLSLAPPRLVHTDQGSTLRLDGPEGKLALSC